MLADQIITAYQDSNLESANTFNRLMDTALRSLDSEQLLALHNQLWPLPCLGEKYVGMNKLGCAIRGLLY